MKLVPEDDYIRAVLGIKSNARKLVNRGGVHRELGLAISDDVDVLISNLKENGYIEDVKKHNGYIEDVDLPHL